MPAQPLFLIDIDCDVTDADVEAVLAPEPWEEVVRIADPHDATMEALAAHAGLFPSRGQARRNGFSGPVPWGLNLFGTNQRTFWVWNPHPSEAAPTISAKRDKTAAYFRFTDEVTTEARCPST